MRFHEFLFAVGLMLGGLRALYFATSGNRECRVELARMFRHHQWRDRSVFVRWIRRLMWWPLLNRFARASLAAGGALACLVGAFLIVR